MTLITTAGRLSNLRLRLAALAARLSLILFFITSFFCVLVLVLPLQSASGLAAFDQLVHTSSLRRIAIASYNCRGEAADIVRDR
jgi:hypothetical protein